MTTISERQQQEEENTTQPAPGYPVSRKSRRHPQWHLLDEKPLFYPLHEPFGIFIQLTHYNILPYVRIQLPPPPLNVSSLSLSLSLTSCPKFPVVRHKLFFANRNGFHRTYLLAHLTNCPPPPAPNFTSCPIQYASYPCGWLPNRRFIIWPEKWHYEDIGRVIVLQFKTDKYVSVSDGTYSWPLWEDVRQR